MAGHERHDDYWANQDIEQEKARAQSYRPEKFQEKKRPAGPKIWEAVYLDQDHSPMAAAIAYAIAGN